MKNQTHFLTYVLTFLSPILLKIEGFISLGTQILTKEHTMNTFEMFELIALPFFFLGVFWYFDKRFKSIRKDLQSQSEILREDAHEIDMYILTATKRREQYLYDCIKAGHLLPSPEKWLTNEEERLHASNSNKRDEILNEINERLEKP